MFLASSLPAQAASAIGSSRIAARFADIPKCNKVQSVIQRSDAREVLDRLPAKRNSHLDDRRPLSLPRNGPGLPSLGSNGGRTGPVSVRERRGGFVRPRRTML